MNFKTTLVLLILLALLGGFVFLMRDRAPDYEAEQKRLQAAAQGQPLFTADQIKASDIDTLTLTHQSHSATFRKTGNTWQQVEPVVYPLTSWMVDDLVNEAIALKYRETFTPGRNDHPAADTLGLEPARASLTLTSSADASKQLTLEVGRAFTGAMAYVRVKGQPAVYVVADSFARQLTEDPIHRLRQKSLVTPTESQTDTFTLTTADAGAVTLTKTQGRWNLQEPHAGRGSRETIQALLTSLGSTAVQKFIADAPDDLSRYGLDQPRLTLTAVSSKVEPSAQVKPVTQTLRVGGPVDLDSSSYFATWTQDQDKPAVITLAASAVAKLEKKLADLRDPKLTTLKAGDVRHLTLHHQSSKLSLTRSANGWEFDDPQIKHRADDAAISDLVTALTNVKAAAFVSGDSQRGDALASIELTGLAQGEPVVLDVWEHGKDEKDQPTWLVRPRHETVAMVVPAQGLTLALAPAWQLRDRTLADLPADRVHRLELTRPGQPALVFTRSLPASADEVTVGPQARDVASPWSLQGDEKTSLNQTTLGQLVEALSPLKAHRWLAPGTTAGPATRTLRAVAGVDQVIELTVDAQGIATLSGVDQPFELLPATLALLEQDHRDASHTQPAPSTVPSQ